MQKIFSTAILATTLLLTACGGGSSDSSGSGYNGFDVDFYEARIRHLPSCQIDHTLKIIHAGRTGRNDRISQLVPQECKVRMSDINGGYAFSLKCQRYVGTNERPAINYYATKKYEQSVVNLIQSGKPYIVACIK